MASDGKVIISTQLDNNGLKKGLSTVSGSFGGLKSVLGKIGGLVAAAFSVKTIVQFGAAASKAAMQMSDAYTGLQSILDGQGRSFSDAKDFIEEYTQDGLVPATNAITAYKNLAMRGYDDSQIRSVMNALKDASAYGRQASYTMGEAVESATEGLKNENSVLVDNAGVTKNVAKMWEEYAASIGTTANNLTQEQKIQAEVNGILAESKYQTGDAAKVAETLSGRLQQLSFNFTNLKISVGNIVNPIVNALLPALNASINAITIFANKLASIVGGVFGSATTQTESIASSALEAAEAEKSLASGIGSASKAAKRAAAGFDELNVLQDNTGSGGGGSSSASASTETSMPAVTPTVDSAPVSQAVDTIKTKLSELSGWFEGTFAPSIEAWKNVLSPVASGWDRMTSSMGVSLTKLRDTNLAPFGAYIVNDWIPGIVNKFNTTFAPILSDIMPAAMDAFTIDFENGCLIIGEWLDILQIGFDSAGMVFSDMCDSITTNWNKHGGALIQGFLEFKQGLWDTFWYIYDNIIRPVIDGIGQTFSWLWTQHLKPLWDKIVSFVMSTQENILQLWNGFLKPVVDWLIAFLAPVVTWVVSSVRDAIAVAVAFISDIIGAFLTFLDGFITFITGVFTLDWQRAWSGIAKMFEGVFGAISAVAKGIVNTIIYCINTLISAVYSGIRGVVNGLGSIVKSAGKILGKDDWGFSMPSYTPQIPYLAQGAVLPANKPFLAMVGDQKNGTNIEAPLATIQEALANVMATQQDRPIEVYITAEGDVGQLVRMLKFRIDKENRRRGTSVAKGAVL